MDFSNCCRLCLSQEGRQSPYLRTLDEALNARILSYLCIEVSQFDDLPKEICHRCECQLNVWHYFKEDCEVSQRKLRRWNRTHCNSTVQGDRAVDCDQEVIQIKQEPNDIDLDAEQYINHSEDLGSTQFNEYGLAIGDDEPREKQFTEYHEESDQICNNSKEPDGLGNPCNLVISATTSILPEENASGPTLDSISKNERIDSVSLASDRDFETSGSKDQTEDGDTDTDTNSIVFVEKPSQGHAVIEVNLESSNDGLSSHPAEAKNAIGQKPNFEEPNVFKRSMEIKTTGAEDQARGIKIKEEPGESLIGPGSYTEENGFSMDCISSDNEGEQSTRKRSLKVSSVGPTSGPNSKRPSLARQFRDNIPVYYFKDLLPKINNDAFDENTKYCKICNKSFQNSNLWRHMSNLHPHVNPFQCGGCGKDFPGRRELVTHRVKTISKYCRAGKQPEVDTSSIICNGKIGRGKPGRFQCGECKEKFGHLSSAKSHVRVHTGEKPFFCYKCNEKEFRLKKSAYKHVSACCGRSDTPPILPKEKKKVVSTSVAVSKVLKQKAMKSKENKFKCKKCGKVFHNGVGYANHLRVECLRKCSSCSKNVSARTFYKHLRKCLKSTENHTSGIECVDSFGSKNSTMPTLESSASLVNVKTELDTSESKNGLDETKIKRNARVTELVDMSFKELVNQHRDEEGKLKEGECKICCKTLGSYKSMHAHLFKHCNKAFKCDICNLAMSLRSTYKAHMSKFHGGHQDFSKAALSSNLRRGPCALAKGKHKFSGFNISKPKCDICLKVFSSISSLKFHKQTHKRVKCEKCEITFPSNMEKSHVCTPKLMVDANLPNQGEVVSHVLSEARAVQYTCQLCKKKFHTRKMLYQHKKMHIKMKIYKCKICGNSYSDAGALQQHKEEEHAAELEVPLNGADVIDRNCAVDTVSADVGATVNTQVKLWKCGVCSKEYSRMDTWSKHMKLHRGIMKTPVAIHKPQNPGVLFCSLCDKALESEASFSRHKGWHSRWYSRLEVATALPHTPANTEPSTSEDMVKKVPSQESGTSSPPVVFNCTICSKKFSSQKSLRIHAHYHGKDKKKDSKDLPKPHIDSPQLPMAHKCEVCASTFPDLPSFSTHMNTHMGGSVEPTGLSKEVTKTEPMQCKLCNKEYRSKKSLKYHMMGHSGEKPYKCRSCSNQYSNPTALAKHEKERHTPILRPFCCNKCKTSFILKEDLLAHHEKCTH